MSRLILFILLAGLLGLKNTKAQVCSELRPVFNAIDKEVREHSEVYARLGNCIDEIGHRLSGSSNGAKAERHVYDLLHSYGFESVTFQPFLMNSWMRNNVQITVGDKINMAPIDGLAFALTPAQADVETELVDLENGLETDYLSFTGNIKGKVALVSLGILPNSSKDVRNRHRSVKIALAERYGAVGVIFINSHEGGILSTGASTINGEFVSIPAVCIRFEDGLSLKDRLKNKVVTVRINMKNTVGKTEVNNVIARIEGSEIPNEKIVVGAHLDSWDLSGGALDNGSGAFTLIDIARTFKSLGIHTKRTIEFVLFMGEEQGMLGSRAYVNQAVKDGSIDQIRYMVNFDIVNDPKAFATSPVGTKALFNEITSIVSAIDSSFSKYFTTRVTLYSDHQPFMLQGIPTAETISHAIDQNMRVAYHTDRDAFNLIDEKGIKNAVRFGAMLVYGIADANELPVKQTLEQTKQMLISHQLDAILRIHGEWR